MKIYPIRATEHTRRKFRELKSTHVDRATLWPVNDDAQVHDAISRLRRLESEQLHREENWMMKLMKGLRSLWE